jgi:hypothetical protein
LYVSNIAAQSAALSCVAVHAALGNNKDWSAVVVGDFNEANARTYLLEYCNLPKDTVVSNDEWDMIYDVRPESSFSIKQVSEGADFCHFLLSAYCRL